ncbi:MAG: hypothetical protein LDL06_02680 [Candidatus Nitrosotenuis sp.]|nr:hypothetical protein [Candidatus Nitrosotenuis sp.]
MSTDWIEVHDHGAIYQAKVYLTDEGEAYMLTIQDGKKRFYKVDARLFRLGELRFFEKVMEDAKELPLECALEMRLIDRKEQ